MKKASGSAFLSVRMKSRADRGVEVMPCSAR